MRMRVRGKEKGRRGEKKKTGEEEEGEEEGGRRGRRNGGRRNGGRRNGGRDMHYCICTSGQVRRRR